MNISLGSCFRGFIIFSLFTVFVFILYYLRFNDEIKSILFFIAGGVLSLYASYIFNRLVTFEKKITHSEITYEIIANCYNQFCHINLDLVSHYPFNDKLCKKGNSTIYMSPMVNKISQFDESKLSVYINFFENVDLNILKDNFDKKNAKIFIDLLKKQSWHLSLHNASISNSYENLTSKLIYIYFMQTLGSIQKILESEQFNWNSEIIIQVVQLFRIFIIRLNYFFYVTQMELRKFEGFVKYISKTPRDLKSELLSSCSKQIKRSVAKRNEILKKIYILENSNKIQ